MWADDVSYDGTEIDCHVTMWRDGHAVTVSPAPEILGAVGLRTSGPCQIDTSFRIGLTYDHAKCLCMIRNPGARLTPSVYRSLLVRHWLVYPVDTVSPEGEIVTVDRLVIESPGSVRHYTDCQRTVSSYMYALYRWEDEEELWPILYHPI